MNPDKSTQRTQADTVRLALYEENSERSRELRAALAQQPDFTIVGETREARELEALLARAQCDAAILDLDAPRSANVAAFLALRKRFPRVKTLVLAEKKNLEIFKRTVGPIADGFLPRATPPERIADAIRSLLGGESPPADHAAYFRSERDAPPPVEPAVRPFHEDPLARLTRRELQVLTLVAGGKMNREVAAELGISKRTVEFHRANLMDKLGLGNVADLVKFAVERRLI